MCSTERQGSLTICEEEKRIGWSKDHHNMQTWTEGMVDKDDTATCKLEGMVDRLLQNANFKAQCYGYRNKTTVGLSSILSVSNSETKRSTQGDQVFRNKIHRNAKRPTSKGRRNYHAIQCFYSRFTVLERWDLYTGNWGVCWLQYLLCNIQKFSVCLVATWPPRLQTNW